MTKESNVDKLDNLCPLFDHILDIAYFAKMHSLQKTWANPLIVRVKDKIGLIYQEIKLEITRTLQN